MKKREVILRPVISNPRIPEEIIRDSRVKLGASWTHAGKLLTGLTKEEERRLMPRIVEMDPDQDPNAYRQAVSEYFADISIDPGDTDGIVLNVTTDEDGEPVNPDHYVKWKYALAHSSVAKTPQERDNMGLYTFELVDKAEEKAKQKKLFNIKMEAEKAYHKLLASEDKAKLFWVSDLAAIDVPRDDEEGIMKELKDYSADYPREFLAIVQDENLEQRAKLYQLVQQGIVERIGNSFIHENATLGNSEDEAIAFMNNDSNSEEMIRLNAKLQQLAK